MSRWPLPPATPDRTRLDPWPAQVLLDPDVPGFAEDTIFVAGDRVTTGLLPSVVRRC